MIPHIVTMLQTKNGKKLQIFARAGAAPDLLFQVIDVGIYIFIFITYIWVLFGHFFQPLLKKIVITWPGP